MYSISPNSYPQNPTSWTFNVKNIRLKQTTQWCRWTTLNSSAYAINTSAEEYKNLAAG